MQNRCLHILFKVVAITVTCLFMFEIAAPAASGPITLKGRSTLGVQSIFEPLLNEGISVSAELQSELFLGVGSLMHSPSGIIANALLNEMYAPESGISRIEFQGDVEKSADVVRAKFRVREKGDVLFSVEYRTADASAEGAITADSLRGLFELVSSPAALYENIFRAGDVLTVSRVIGILPEKGLGPGTYFPAPGSGFIASGPLEERLDAIESMAALNEFVPRKETTDEERKAIGRAKEILNEKKSAILDEIERLSPPKSGHRKKPSGRKARQKAKKQEKRKTGAEREALESAKEAAREILEELLSSDDERLFYLFSALADGSDNYIAGFNKEFDEGQLMGLSTEMIERLRRAPELLAEYLFHEAFCGVILPHRELVELQRRIFGGENRLGGVIRGLISDKVFEKIAVREDMGEMKWVRRGRAFSSPEGADIPVRVEFSDEAIAFGLTPEIAGKMISLISARNRDLTGIREEGRSLVIPLAGNNILSAGGRTFTAIKVKQVTHRGGPPVLEAYDDRDDHMQQPRKSMAIGPDGRLRVSAALSHPKGGGYLTESINEYGIMREAFHAGIPTAFPIGVGEFTGMGFEGRAMGFVIMAIEDKEDKRVGSEIKKKILRAHERGQSRERQERFASLDDVKKAYAELNEKIKASAKTLRALHEEGIIHTQPHLSNFGYSDRTAGQVYDLTKGKSFRGMTREEFIYYVFNDFRAFYATTTALAVSEELTPAALLTYARIIANLRIPLFAEPIFYGYFTREDMLSIGEGRILDAINLGAMGSLIFERWNERAVDGKTLEEALGRDYPLAGVFNELAGNMYDRLRRELEEKEERKLKEEYRSEKELLAAAKEKLAGRSVNMHIDLSVIQRGGAGEEARNEMIFEESMKALAHEIARHNALGLDVRYMLHDVTSSGYKEKAVVALTRFLKDIARAYEISPDDLLNKIERPHPASTDGGFPVLTVRLGSVDEMEILKSDSSESDAFTYAACLGNTRGEDGVSIPNYPAAADIGLALAALGIAGEQEKKREISRAEYERERKKAAGNMTRIFGLYDVDTTGFSEEVLEAVVKAMNPVTRFDFALSFALPPVIKWTVELLKQYNEARELLLSYA